MRAILFLVFIFLSIGTLAGFVTGWVFMNDPISAALVSYVEMRPPQNGKVILNYTCNHKVLAAYDVDTGKVISPALSDEEVATLREGNLDRNRFPLRNIVEHIATLATGAGAVTFAKPLTKIVKDPKNSRFTIPSAIAAASGYYLGYGLATWSLLPCDDEMFVGGTQSADIWKILKRDVAVHYFLQVMSASDQDADLAKARQMIEDRNITSETFVILYSLGKYSPEIQETPRFTREKVLKVYLPIGLFILLAVGAGYVLDLSRAKRKRPAKPKAAKGATTQ